MAATVYYSNRMEELTRRLGENISKSPCKVFNKEYIITQTAGMNRWLAVEMAKKEYNGVFANFELVNQDAFLHELLAFMSPGNSQYNAETVKWILFDLLGSEAFKSIERFSPVINYIEDNNLKRVQLAARIVDLFDQYQVYREGLVESWNNNRAEYPGLLTEECRYGSGRN
jgi:exodeoxyribonuclease V gamma subunit